MLGIGSASKKVTRCNVTKEQAREITTVLSKYLQVLTDVPGCTNVLEYEIKVTNNDPIKLKSNNLYISRFSTNTCNRIS
jgi:hypothetical protein